MQKKSFVYRNGLSIVLAIIFSIFLFAQAVSGAKEHNKELLENGGATMTLAEYLASPHFVSATFENWESEFLQMGMYVLLTVFLRQKGSSESKSLDKKEDVDRQPVPRANAPWPVKKGGIWLSLYKNSLFLAFIFLFLVSFVLHAYGSWKEENAEEALKGKGTIGFGEFLSGSRLWFESFQNWQSEFVAVFSIVVLSIFLRQQGSPESKPVDAPDSETGS